MSNVTSTNIRIGPGFYLAIKRMSEESGASMGLIANLFLMLGVRDLVEKLPKDIQSAVAADILSTIGELFKLMGLELIKNSSLAELYKNLLSPNKKYIA